MITEDGKHEVCDEPHCEAKIKNHYWGHVRADDWFFQKSGEAWCPLHHPEWVAEWRARKQGQA